MRHIPFFEVLAVFQGPVQVGANSGTVDPVVVPPTEERRKSIKDQFRTWEMLLYCQSPFGKSE